MASTFLTPEELVELTGKRRAAAQIEQLRKMGLLFYENAAHKPVVPREPIIGKPTGSYIKKTTWESRAAP